jgi:hypothetical protein
MGVALLLGTNVSDSQGPDHKVTKLPQAEGGMWVSEAVSGGDRDLATQPRSSLSQASLPPPRPRWSVVRMDPSKP